MQNCCHKCHSTEGLKRYGVTKNGHIISEEMASSIRRIGAISNNIFLANPIPRTEYLYPLEYSCLFCPKCAESGKAS